MTCESSAAQGFGLVSSVYATGRAFVPGPLVGVAGNLEHRVAALSGPVITAVQDQSERVRAPPFQTPRLHQAPMP